MPFVTADFIAAVVDLQEAQAVELARLAVAAGMENGAVLEASREAMRTICDRYERGEYALPELILAAEVLKEVYSLLGMVFREGENHGQTAGTVVIGTVAGDIHDIGKDIVVFLLDANHFRVFDLGVDVPSELFLEAIREVEPDIVGLSGFLTLAFDSMKEIVEAIAAAGLRDSVKIMVGGAPMDEVVLGYVGADAYGRDAAVAVHLAQRWVAAQPPATKGAGGLDGGSPA